MLEKHRIIAAEVGYLDVSPRTRWWHVGLQADSGLSGAGEASLVSAPADYRERLERAANELIGRPVDEDALIPLAVLLEQGLTGRTIHAALDQALMDICSKAEGVPLFRYLNGDAVLNPIRLYANINRTTTDRTPRGFAASAVRAVSEGHKSLKIAAFDGLSPNLCGTAEGDAMILAGLSRLQAVAAAQDSAELRVDCHWRFTADAAIDLLPALHEMGVCWLECPIPETGEAVQDLRRIRRAANKLGIRVCGLETAGGWREIAPFVEGGAYDVIMPDVKHAGRLVDIIGIAENAARHNVRVSLHNPTGPVSHQFSAHVSTALGGPERMEFQWNESPRFFDITDPPPQFDRDCCSVTKTPGLGLCLRGGAASFGTTERDRRQ